MNINQGQITKRPKRQFTRKAKIAGELAAGSLGDIQSPKKAPFMGGTSFFKYRQWAAHTHTWLIGTDNAVCSQCGKLVPKAELTTP
jgi:hypothetical protein